MRITPRVCTSVLSFLVQSNNVGKGSRQNGSVTSGKGLALRAGSVGLRREVCGREVGWRSVAAPSPPVRAGGGVACASGASVRERVQLERPPRSPRTGQM